VLIVEGKLNEYKKKYPQAVENYLAAIKFGQAFGGENAVLRSKLISISVESLGYKALKDFLKNNPNKGEKFYSNLLSQLDKIRKNEKSMKSVIALEFQSEHNGVEKEPRTGMFAIIAPSNSWYAIKIGMYFLFRKGTVLKNMDDFHKEFLYTLNKPYAEYKDINWDKRIQKLDIINRIFAPNYTFEYFRSLVILNQSWLTELGTAIQLYQSQKGHYPDSLDDLSLSILKDIPKDPFTDKLFVYHKTDKGFELYSPGPDMMDDNGTLIYDPTNGTISAGDIVW